MATTSSSFNYICRRKPNAGEPIKPGSIVYDAQNRPISAIYMIGKSEVLIEVTYSSEGYLIFEGTEYRSYQWNLWTGILEPVVSVAVDNGNVEVVVGLADGFATQKINVSGVVQIVNNAQRISIAIRNWSDPEENLILYIAEDNTTLTDGWPLVAQEGASFDLDPNTSIYLAPSSGTIDTRILEVTKT